MVLLVSLLGKQSLELPDQNLHITRFLGRFCAHYNLKITDLGNLNSNSILWFLAYFTYIYIYINLLKILIKIRQTLASWSNISLVFKDFKAQPVLILYYLQLFSCATGDWIVSHRDGKILLFLSWNCVLIWT